MNGKLCVSTDCICDLGEEILGRSEIPVIYFHVITDSGDFKDIQEITSENVTEYLSGGGVKASSQAPSAEEFYEFFEENTRSGRPLLHICAGKEMSLSYENACEAAKKFDNVTVFDSGQISSGLGLIVLEAVRLAENGAETDEIVTALEKYKERVSVSFITYNAEYLCRSGLVGNFFKNLCADLHLHPVIKVKNGKMVRAGVMLGRYEHAGLRYARTRLGTKKYERDSLFVTYVGLNRRQIESILEEVRKRSNFGNIYVTKASATISVNSGPETLGLLYVKK